MSNQNRNNGNADLPWRLLVLEEDSETWELHSSYVTFRQLNVVMQNLSDAGKKVRHKYLGPSPWVDTGSTRTR